MAQIDQILSYIKQINETMNSWLANAKKLEELPEMIDVDPLALLMVSGLDGGTYKSKKLHIQKLIDSLSLSGQDNKVREIILGSITEDNDLNYLLDNNGITVAQDEIIMLTALEIIDNTLIQKQYIWKLGKGDFNPIGSTDINTKLIELQPKFLSDVTADELTSSPSAIVYDFGVITDDILDVVNNADPARDYTDDEKIYYIRATKDDVKYLYNFIGINDTYGDSENQITNDDLVLVYSSKNNDITSLLIGKTDKGGYEGTSQDLSNRIALLENFPKIQFIANGVDNTFDLTTTAKVKAVFWNGALLDDADWSQTLNILTIVTFTPNSGETIKPI